MVKKSLFIENKRKDEVLNRLIFFALIFSLVHLFIRYNTFLGHHDRPIIDYRSVFCCVFTVLINLLVLDV